MVYTKKIYVVYTKKIYINHSQSWVVYDIALTTLCAHPNIPTGRCFPDLQLGHLGQLAAAEASQVRFHHEG